MMKETVTELNKRFEELSKKCSNYEKAVVSLVVIEFEDHEKKRSMIDDIRQLVRKTSKERQAVLDAIDALQKVCEHTFPDGKSAFCDNGNDSHYSYQKYDFSHPDAPNTWALYVPNDQPQKGDMIPCIEIGNHKLTVGKEYRNIGYSSMGDRLWVVDDNNKLILVNLKCFINYGN